jgi:hypothetical protein
LLLYFLLLGFSTMATPTTLSGTLGRSLLESHHSIVADQDSALSLHMFFFIQIGLLSPSSSSSSSWSTRGLGTPLLAFPNYIYIYTPMLLLGITHHYMLRLLELSIHSCHENLLFFHKQRRMATAGVYVLELPILCVSLTAL